jgi:translation initiation factor 3 subunit C
VSSHQKQADKSLEDELEEKKRYIPPHLHINLEFLDCVYMTTSMFLEIPNLSENKFTVQKNVINRNFRKLIE